MNSLRRASTATALVMAFLVSFLSPAARAQDEPVATIIDLTAGPALDERGRELPGRYSLVAIVTTEDGRYVAKRSVQFVENVEFFGARSSSLGTSTTDSTGYALVVYQAATSGPHTIIARISGNSTYAASEASLNLDVTDPVAPFEAEPLPLASIGHWLGLFLAVLGVAFWTVLLGVLVRTVRQLRLAPRLAKSATAGVAPRD